MNINGGNIPIINNEFSLVKLLFIILALVLCQSVIFIKGNDPYNDIVHNVTDLLTVTEHCNYLNNTVCELNSSRKRVIRDILKNSKGKKTPKLLKKSGYIISFEFSKKYLISEIFPQLSKMSPTNDNNFIKTMTKRILLRLKKETKPTLNKLEKLYPSVPDFVESIFEQFMDNCFEERNYKLIENLLTGTRDFNLLFISFKYLNNGFTKYEEFTRRDKLIYKYPEMFEFSQVLRNLTFWKGFLETPHYFQNIIKYFISKFPECLQALTKSKAICIKNHYFNEYLYAAGDPLFLYDKNRRYVFSWKPGYRVDKAFFYPIHYRENMYEFKNHHYGEYLYAADIKFNVQKRHIFTWRYGATTRTRGIWEVDAGENDWCSLKNVHYKEYLAASKELYDNDRRYIFTFQNKFYGDFHQKHWLIIDC